MFNGLFGLGGGPVQPLTPEDRARWSTITNPGDSWQQVPSDPAAVQQAMQALYASRGQSPAQFNVPTPSTSFLGEPPNNYAWGAGNTQPPKMYDDAASYAAANPADYARQMANRSSVGLTGKYVNGPNGLQYMTPQAYMQSQPWMQSQPDTRRQPQHREPQRHKDRTGVYDTANFTKPFRLQKPL